MKDLCTPFARLCLSLLLLAALLPAHTAAGSTAASNLAHSWLQGQMSTSGLVESYQDNRDICYTYDQAVAAIAFLVKGDTANAQRVLDALKSMQYADGSWNTAYYCETKAVQESARHVGPVLWAAMAVAHYERLTGDTLSYHAMATDAVEWSLQFQQSDGGINGGLDYDGSLLAWASTEHNEDAYAALSYFGYSNEAAAVKSFLDTVVWAGDHWIGGRDDPRDPLDVNSWGVCALGPSGTHSYRVSLDYALAHHRNTQSFRGKTYDAFDFDSDQDDIWFEGSGQMVVAFTVDGRSNDAEYFLGQIVQAQDRDGGVPYSLRGTHNGYWKMSTADSVAATGWLIYAADGFNPFDL